MAFDWQVFWDALTSYLLFQGACITVALTSISFICALLIAMPLALIISSNNKWLKVPARIYIGLFRGAPTLLQLLFIWNALPQLAPIFREGWFTPFIAASIALSLNESAYEVEIIRSALLSVDTGQRDAAQALGLSKFQVLRLVILPQALRVAIAPMVNQFVSLLKITSLASVISLQELLTVTSQIIATTFRFTEYYVVALLYYLGMIYIIMYVQGRLERRLMWKEPQDRKARKGGETPALSDHR